MSNAFAMTLTVEMKDGRELEVTVDQRDWAQMEILDLPAAAVVARTRALAYHAMRRAGHYNGRWERFSETDCLRVTEVDVDDDDQADGGDQPDAGEVADPKATPAPPAGRPEAGAASTSSSPARRAGRSKR